MLVELDELILTILEQIDKLLQNQKNKPRLFHFDFFPICLIFNHQMLKLSVMYKLNMLKIATCHRSVRKHISDHWYILKIQ